MSSLFTSSSSSSSSSSSTTTTTTTTTTSSTTTTTTSSAISLRIVAINDVYELDNLPHYRVAKDAKSEGHEVAATMQKRPNKCIGVIAGDFLSPSLLASIDKGYGMIDLLNNCGVDYCCIGNHEGDLEYKHFVNRVKESKFTWVNSNIPGLPDLNLPEYVILELESEDKTHKRRVALIGLCCDDLSVFSRDPFKGTRIEPVYDKAVQLFNQIMVTENVDVVIPMTHQMIHLDRQLAKSGMFPLIIGGHEHEVYREVEVGGSAFDGTCTIVKTGSEATHFATCDISWDSPAAPKEPKVTVTLEDTKNYSIDKSLEALMNSHKSVVDELLSTPLFKIDHPFENLSSIGTRLKQTTMGSVICNTIQSELNVECVCIVGGCIRAKRDYKAVATFTYGLLKAELPFDTAVMFMELPGQVLCDCIEYSRKFSLQSPPVEIGSFFQCDDQVVWDGVSNKVTHINGAPVDSSKTYRIAIHSQLIDGMDNIIPLMQYKATLPPSHKLTNHDRECDINVKHIIVSHFSKNLLMHMLNEAGGFSAIDTNHDGGISKEELIHYLVSSGRKSVDTTAILINNIFNVADIDHNGLISRRELLELELTSMPTGCITSSSSISTRDALKAAAARLGWSEFDDDESLLKEAALDIDSDINGEISASEYEHFVTKIAKKRKVDI